MSLDIMEYTPHTKGMHMLTDIWWKLCLDGAQPGDEHSQKQH